MRMGLLLVLAAGCDYTFNLDHIAPAQGSVDAPLVDGRGGTQGDAFDVSLCPASYDRALQAGSRYRIVTTFATAWAQFDDCDDDLPGATHLAVLETAAEQTLVHTAQVSANQYRWWIGAVQSPLATTTKDMWNWLVGEPIATTAWAANEPDDLDFSETDHQEQFAVSQQDTTGIVDIGGVTSAGALCECDGRATVAYVRGWVDAYRP